MEIIKIDGSMGEGGGQILRSSLTLSMIAGQPFRIENIRSGRERPGLQRQHLMAVQAAAAVSSASVIGAELGSTALTFSPGVISSGDYVFDIGSAGSVTLVLQAVMLALAHADDGRPSTVTITGGTHNHMAPPTHFLDRTYCALLRQMGFNISVSLERFGFYPRGGGRIVATIVPGKRGSVNQDRSQVVLLDRGPLIDIHVQSVVAGAPVDVAARESEYVVDVLKEHGFAAIIDNLEVDRKHGPGNVVLVTVRHENVTEVFSSIGQRGVPAEEVAQKVATEVLCYLRTGAMACEHLADQLLLPLALLGGGSFTTGIVSDHATTNGVVISRFLPVETQWSLYGQGNLCTVVAR